MTKIIEKTGEPQQLRAGSNLGGPTYDLLASTDFANYSEFAKRYEELNGEGA